MRGVRTNTERPVWRKGLLAQAAALCDEHPDLVPDLAEFSSCCRRLADRELYRGLVRVAHRLETDAHLALRSLLTPSTDAERRAHIAVIGRA